jgi:HK97 family phage prohead protease
MHQQDKKLTRKNREFRQMVNFELRAAAADNGNQELYVEGYAATFNDPTVIWEMDGIEYKEQINSQAFASTDMTDVIFNYNHSGKVMARTRNKTLTLNIDQKGLYIRARLDGTEEGRQMYNDIKGGYIDRMSFAFTVSESSYDSDKHMRTILTIKKLYDVSAVDIPAYDSTSISARSYFELEREKEKAAEADEQRKRLILKTYL